MTRERTDVHRPAEMVAADYRWLAGSYPGGEDDSGQTVVEWDGTEEWEGLGRPMESTCAHARAGKCDHCGASHRYQAIILHVPTGEVLSVGQTCAVERFDRPEWKRVIADGARRAELKAEREHNIAAALAVMDEPTQAAYEWATTDENVNATAKDIAQKVAKFGPLSEKQATFLVKLHAETQETVRKVAAGEVAACPEGRVEIVGIIVSEKQVADPFAGRWGSPTKTKILVQDDRGFRVFGTAPGALFASTVPFALKGLRVRFTATLEPKQDDPTFGFYSRPTKVMVSD